MDFVSGLETKLVFVGWYGNVLIFEQWMYDALRDFVRSCNHLYNLKNVKNTNRRVLFLVELQASACNFAKSNIPPRVFLTFFKLYKWYQIAQSVTYGYLEIKCYY